MTRPTPVHEVIERYLSEADRARRGRRFQLRVAQAVTVLATALTLALLVLPWAPGVRGWVVLALASVGLAGLGHVLVPVLRRSRTRDVAAWLARREPALGGALADAHEFADALSGGKPPGAGSPSLARAHVRETARRVAQDDPSRHARTAWPRLGGRGAVVAAACALVALLALPRARDLLFLGIAPGARDAARYDGVELSYSYPAYLGLDPRTEFGSGDVQAPSGTHVTVRVTADRPLDWARLELEGGPAQEMEVKGDVATGRLVVVADGRYRLRLKGTVGDVDVEPPVHAVQALPDRSPTVRLSAPAGDEVLDPDQDLDLIWRVADDYGVAEVVLVLLPDDGSDVRDEAVPAGALKPPEAGQRTLEVLDPPALARVGSRRLSPQALGLEPGTSGWLSVWARDADIVGGPKWARSRSVRVTVRSREQLQHAVDSGQEELAEALLAVLARHLVEDPARQSSREALADAGDRFRDGLRVVLGLFDPVLRHLYDGVEEDLAAVQALEDMRLGLRTLLARRREELPPVYVQTRPLTDVKARLLRMHPDEIEELEKDVLFFDMWADRRSALRAADAAGEFERALQGLVDTLGEPGTEGEPEDGEVGEALDEVGTELEGLAERARQLRQGLSDPAEAIASEEGFGAARQLIEEIREHLGASRNEDARWAGRELEATGSELAAAVQDMAAQGAMADPELMEAVREFRRELERVRAKQADLRDRTNAVRDEARENLSDEDRAAVDERFEELIALADQAVAQHEDGEAGMAEAPAVQRFFERLDEQASIQQRLRSLMDAGHREGRLPSRAEQQEAYALQRRLTDLELQSLLGPGDVEPLMRHSERAREQLGRLRQTLADRDLSEAERPARTALWRLDELAQGLESSSEDGLADRSAPFRAAQASVAEILTLLEELDQARRSAAERALTAQQRQRLRELGDEEGALAEQARQLAEQLQEAGVDAPFLGQEVGDAVGQASDSMREADGRLGQGEPGTASEAQGEALARLEQASESLSPSQGGGRSGARSAGRAARRGGPQREDVEIPDADAYRVPKEFREEILQAMRESAAPPGYEEPVREYYRRLVE